ncbi:MAG: lantibiotic dehydratase, partial [Acidimicrobiia bacterium]
MIPSGFFVLRTPLLPFDELAAWGEDLESPRTLTSGDPARLGAALAADRERLRARLGELISRPEVRHAVSIASPRVEAAIDAWAADPTGPAGTGLEPVLVAYLARATSRPTPFGLFAGWTTGTLGTCTNLGLGPRSGYRRQSRIEMDVLWALSEAVGCDPRLRDGFEYRPNPTLFEVRGRLRYIEARRSADLGRSLHHLVAVDRSPYLVSTLARAEMGATFDALAAALIDEDVSRAEAEEFVAELVESQLLVAPLAPPVTGEEAGHALVADLAASPATAETAKGLDTALTALAAVDAEGLAATPGGYQA